MGTAAGVLQSLGKLIFMQPMTKEHFWNLLQAQFPEQMNDFTAWLEEYKRRNEWGLIFEYPTEFYGIPPAMQIGIFIQYTVETGGSPFPVPVDLSLDAWIGAIPRWFEMEHEMAQKPVE
ncbi:MAG TPA: hypothetical protein VKQ08_04750 [Cyclobacteriaceae bacterium]|nr:hypothetical protein [Cyclobacteriaceae bacterium]